MGRKDIDILRELAGRVAEIAALPEQQEKIALWKSLNRLEPVRPMLLIGSIPWHEMDVDGELTLKTRDEFCRRLETRLRRTLYGWRHLSDDRVVEPFVRIPKTIRGLGENLGIKPLEERAVTDADSNIVGHHYKDQFLTEEDLEKICTPQVIPDETVTGLEEERARDIFDGILGVRMEGHFPRFTPWDRIVEWRGAEAVLTDIVVKPDFMHEIMRRTTEAFLGRLDQLEEKGLLGYDQGVVKRSGAHTDQLPATGFDPDRPRARDIWSSGMAQIFAAASPAIFKEFELDYAVRWYERFGLVYYGCCEPLHDRIDLVSRIPNLRKIAMSPWADHERGAEAIGSRFVFSRHPNPAFLAGTSWNPGRVKDDLRQTREICERQGCPFEFVLQDISTVCYEPQRLWEWSEIAMNVAMGE